MTFLMFWPNFPEFLVESDDRKMAYGYIMVSIAFVKSRHLGSLGGFPKWTRFHYQISLQTSLFVPFYAALCNSHWKLKSGPGPEKLVWAKNFGLDAESLISSLTKHKTCSHSHWQLVVVGLSRRNRCFGHSIKFQSDYTSRGLRGGSNFHKSYHRHLDRPLHTHITSWRYNFPLRCI